VYAGAEAAFGTGAMQALSFRLMMLSHLHTTSIDIFYRRIYGGSHTTLRRMVEEARDAYKIQVENRIRIWTSLDA
jgi:hypothetical protein